MLSVNAYQILIQIFNNRIRAVIEENMCIENSKKLDYTSVDEIKNYINCQYITPYEAI